MSLKFILIQGQHYNGSPRPLFTLKMEVLESIVPQVVQSMNSGPLSQISGNSGRHFNTYKPSGGATWLESKSLDDVAGYLKTFALYHGSLDSNSISNFFKRSSLH